MIPGVFLNRGMGLSGALGHSGLGIEPAAKRPEASETGFRCPAYGSFPKLGVPSKGDVEVIWGCLGFPKIGGTFGASL